jgi:alkylation response protein AidB-like acyl-CoA dehydrogenase
MTLLAGLTEEQAGLASAVSALLTKRSDSAAVRKSIESAVGYDEALWELLCAQIGVAALAIPEEFGGAGARLAETHLVQLELGRHLTPSPLLGTVLSAQLLLALGDEDACTRFLPRIAAGSIVATCLAGVAIDGALNGTSSQVLDGDLAEVLLVVAQTPDGLAVFAVDPAEPGVTRRHTPTMDPTRRLAEVVLDQVAGTRIGGPADDAVRTAVDAARVALSAEQVGAATRALELTVEYAKVRQQFGRPIGSFQALKHRMADLQVLVESARSVSLAACDGVVPADVAKVYCSEAFSAVAAEMIQLHGGIAITWEHDAHLFFKRAHGSALLFGSVSESLRALEGALLC